jgi:membrane glycosyltransferase
LTEEPPQGEGERELAAPLPPERLLHDWRGAADRAVGYLRALDVPSEEHRTLAWRAVVDAASLPIWSSGAGAVGATLASLRRGLLSREKGEGHASAADAPASENDAFLGWRLRRLIAPSEREECPPGPAGASEVQDAPPLLRGHVTPGRAVPDARVLRRNRRAFPWARAARVRHWVLAILVLAPAMLAGFTMTTALPQQGRTVLEVAIGVVFGALFGWISIGFWTALAGCRVLLRGDRHAITRSPCGEAAIGPEARTAILMPICEEPVERVFAGLRALHASLERADALGHFDFFVLSDSTDASTIVEEEVAWADWCRDVNGWGRIFYRRRKVRIAKKAGNVSDFCRRWGRRYRYMVVFDADSVMSGRALVTLVRLMEAHPDAAVIQTVPRSFGRRSLFGRAQQFAASLYTPVFAAGLHYWQLGDAP